MKNRALQLSHAICLSLVVGAAYAATPTTSPPMAHGDMKGMDMKGMGASTGSQMKAHMTKSMQGMQNMVMTGDTDKDFATMMRMHHQCGVEMAQMQIANGKNAEMNSMAKKIVTAQKKEIAQFDTWIANNK